jgi:hypothetical protein
MFENRRNHQVNSWSSCSTARWVSPSRDCLPNEVICRALKFRRRLRLSNCASQLLILMVADHHSDISINCRVFMISHVLHVHMMILTRESILFSDVPINDLVIDFMNWICQHDEKVVGWQDNWNSCHELGNDIERKCFFGWSSPIRLRFNRIWNSFWLPRLSIADSLTFLSPFGVLIGIRSFDYCSVLQSTRDSMWD